MISRLVHQAISRQERKLAVRLDYLRDIARTSISAFLKLALLAPMGNHRRHLPRDAFHVARLAATLSEDCGTCVQIAVNVARQEQVPAAILKAVLRGDLEALPAELADVCRFAQKIARGEDDPALRERLGARYGEAALVELALAIAAARVFPSIKRALGHAQSCSLVRPRLPEEPDESLPAALRAP